jgi:hypothetical protein
VDIKPLVNQVDGAGNVVPHGVIYHCPYFRYQGGSNAIILDPVVGDIGLAVFAERDISSAVASQAQAAPGSWRQHDMADGMYVGGFLGKAAPTQFVEFSASGITITSPTKITLTAPAVQINSTVTCTGDVVAGGISLDSHVHGGVVTGGSNTTGPH